MPSQPNQLTRFLRFLRGESVESGGDQVRRVLTIVGLICLVVLLVSPFVVLAAQTGGGGKRAVHTPTQSATQSVVHTATSTPEPTVDAPAKGLTDNPAYQWWLWPGNPQPDSWWGLEQDQQTLGAQVSLMKELGVKLFRVELVWAFVAPTIPGGSIYDSAAARDPNWSGYQWSRWDMIVQLTAAAGIQLDPMVVYSPDWASGITATTSGGPNEHPLSAQYFGDFMLAAATRYKGQIHYWEMWNEPDFASHTWSDAASGSLQSYVDFILKPGYQAVKQVDPTAKILLGGLAADSNMQTVYDAGGGPYFDIGNFHDYSLTAAGVATAMNHARAMMNANGDSNKPLWLTEFGLKTQPDGGSASSGGASGPTGDEAAQATLIKGVFGMTSLQAIFFYQLHDTAVYSSSAVIAKQVYWGLAHHDLTYRKQGFDAYKSEPSGSLPRLSLGIAPHDAVAAPLTAYQVMNAATRFGRRPQSDR